MQDVSVITVCRNASPTIRRTIDSVLSQSLEPFEYIVIDGASTDGTLDILRSYGDRISTIISEPDGGISDAFNKGIRLAQGGSIKLLNADDWLHEDTLQKSVEALQRNPASGFVFGDILEHDEDHGSVRRIEGDPAYEEWLPRVMGPLNHPTVTVRREVYEAYGLFSEQWKLAMDYDWFLRVHTHGVTGIYDSSIVVNMAAGGRATAGRMQAFREVRDISVSHGYSAWAAQSYYYARIGKHFILRTLGLR